jgi:hypothetical protein
MYSVRGESVPPPTARCRPITRPPHGGTGTSSQVARVGQVRTASSFGESLFDTSHSNSSQSWITHLTPWPGQPKCRAASLSRSADSSTARLPAACKAAERRARPPAPAAVASRRFASVLALRPKGCTRRTDEANKMRPGKQRMKKPQRAFAPGPLLEWRTTVTRAAAAVCQPRQPMQCQSAGA